MPLVNKRKGQVLTLTESSASLMDSESFETLDVPIAEDVKEQIKEAMQVEYWDVEGQKIIKRLL